MTTNQSEFINWDIYKDGFKGDQLLTPNKSIKPSIPKEIVYSHEPYAQELFDIYNLKNIKTVKKDLSKDDCILITNITNIKDESIVIELLGGLSIEVDLNKEKRFIQLYGFNNPREFIDSISIEENLKSFLSNKIYAYVTDVNPNLKVSLLLGYIKNIKKEFNDQIKTPSKAYIAKIKEANKGGYFVDIQGLDAFMPGSLAAPNKLVDFRSLVGKEVIVMIEDYIKEMNSYIVSHKKYVEYMLPIKLQELELDKKYKGVITGCSKYGIFLEFEEICTGLLHISKMKEETKNNFYNNFYKTGEEFNFYISEINKDNRIILTDQSLEERIEKINNFIINSKGKELDGIVSAVMGFGLIIKVDDYNGLVPLKDFKQKNVNIKKYNQGDNIKVKFQDYNDDRLIFELV